MANITAAHLHHMARRHHATMQKVVVIQERVAGIVQRSTSALETGAGAWIGGLLEGRTAGKSVGPIPLNLGVGIVMLAAGHLTAAGKAGVTFGDVGQLSGHLNNLGNGFIGSYLAAAGYAFGKRWRETGKVFGGGGHPWTQPYENGWPHNGAASAAPPQSAGW